MGQGDDCPREREAELSFAKALSALELGTGDLQERAATLSLFASLLKDLGKFDEALLQLASVRSLYQRLADPDNEARTMLHEANILVLLDPPPESC